MTTANVHRVEVTIGSGGHLRASFACDAPVGAPCRLWCNNGCENHPNIEEDGSELEEELFDQGYCVRTEGWFDDEPFDMFDGPNDSPLRSGPVILSWNGDTYTWHYDEAVLS